MTHVHVKITADMYNLSTYTLQYTAVHCTGILGTRQSGAVVVFHHVEIDIYHIKVQGYYSILSSI